MGRSGIQLTLDLDAAAHPQLSRKHLAAIKKPLADEDRSVFLHWISSGDGADAHRTGAMTFYAIPIEGIATLIGAALIVNLC